MNLVVTQIPQTTQLMEPFRSVAGCGQDTSGSEKRQLTECWRGRYVTCRRTVQSTDRVGHFLTRKTGG